MGRLYKHLFYVKGMHNENRRHTSNVGSLSTKKDQKNEITFKICSNIKTHQSVLMYMYLLSVGVGAETLSC